jgi:hypothetical protein
MSILAENVICSGSLHIVIVIIMNFSIVIYKHCCISFSSSRRFKLLWLGTFDEDYLYSFLLKVFLLLLVQIPNRNAFVCCYVSQYITLKRYFSLQIKPFP